MHKEHLFLAYMALVSAKTALLHIVGLLLQAVDV